MNSYNIFKDKRSWKRIDYDNSRGFQCIDLIRQYIKDMWRKQPLALGPNGVKFLALEFNRFWDTKQYAYIENDIKQPNQVPLQGDIIIFSTPTATGHIWIVDSAKPWANLINVLNQNGWRWSTTGRWTDSVIIRAYTYKNVIGRIRKI